MTTQEKALSVSKIAELCGVGRSTIGYWIRSKKLKANRIGKKYFIPIDELICFLESSGFSIPENLPPITADHTALRSYPKCWNYWEGSVHGQGCKECLVFETDVDICFMAKCSDCLQCPKQCYECDYYLKFYLPKIEFTSQIALPAMTYKKFVILGGNSKMVELSGIPKNDLVGMGVENIIHQESLETVIQLSKKRALMDPKAEIFNTVFLKTKHHQKLGVKFSLYPLNDPRDSFLVVAEAIATKNEKAVYKC